MMFRSMIGSWHGSKPGIPQPLRSLRPGSEIRTMLQQEWFEQTMIRSIPSSWFHNMPGIRQRSNSSL